MSSHDRFQIVLKTRYLSLALRIAMKEMEKKKTWLDCCEMAIVQINRLDGGTSMIRNRRTLQKWHHQFRLNNELFVNPALCRKTKRPMLPPMLDRNPELRDVLLKFARKNLDHLTGELLLEYLKNNALPEMVKMRQEEISDSTYSVQSFLSEFGLEFLFRYPQFSGSERCNHQATL